MPERRRRYSLHEVQYIVGSRGEEGAVELYRPFRTRDRRVIVIKETPVHSRQKQRLERSRSLTPVRGRTKQRLERSRSPPPDRRRRRAPSLEPVRIPSPDRYRSIFSVMSPKMPQATFVPLPPKLEKESKSKDKDKKASKDKKSKNDFLWDDESGSNRSNRSSPFYETRSPEDYSPRTKAKRYSQDERQYEVVVPSLDRRPTSRNGNDLVRYENREPRFVPERNLKKVENRSRIYQEALIDAEDAAQYNLQAAKTEEVKRQSAEAEIVALREQIRKLTLQINNANERATRAELEADKVVRDHQLREATSRLDQLEQRQWREIEGSQKPLGSRPLVRRPTLPVSAYTTVNAAPVNTGQAALDQIRQEYQSRKADTEPYIVTSGQGQRPSRRGRSGEGAWR